MGLLRRFEPAFDSVPFAGGFHIPHPWKEVPGSGLSGICSSSDFGPVMREPLENRTKTDAFPFRKCADFLKEIFPSQTVDPTELVAPAQALISCMVLDVFHPWPRDALIGVAERFMVVLEKNIPNEDSRS